MKIPFQAWLLEQAVDADSQSLFDEAFLCYSIGAHRAALVFSYLGFLRILATRLMTADPPTDFPSQLWAITQQKIRDDLTWESATFDAVLRSQPVPVFLVDDDVRNQIQYWRGRRNDAAHSKGNALSYAHVETLWLFVRSNLGRFVVNGGPSGLLEKFRRHFDPTFTPPDFDFFPLVEQIPHSIPSLGYREFFGKLLSLPDIFETDSYFYFSGTTEELLDKIAVLNDSQVTEAFVQEIRANRDLLITILLAKPNFVLHYTNDPILIRDLWHDLLPLSTTGPSHTIHNSLRVIAVMFRNGLIDERVRKTAMDCIVSRIDERPDRDGYPADVLDELAPFGLWKAVRHHAFENYEHIQWSATNLALAIEYLERHPVDWRIAETFCGLFPRAVPDSEEWLASTNLAEPEDHFGLHYYFSQHPDLFREIVRVAREHKINHKFFYRQMNPKRLGS